jgi:hypothetical protein
MDIKDKFTGVVCEQERAGITSLYVKIDNRVGTEVLFGPDEITEVRIPSRLQERFQPGQRVVFSEVREDPMFGPVPSDLRVA